MVGSGHLSKEKPENGGGVNPVYGRRLGQPGQSLRAASCKQMRHSPTWPPARHDTLPPPTAFTGTARLAGSAVFFSTATATSGETRYVTVRRNEFASKAREGRQPCQHEKRVLVGFVGWGELPRDSRRMRWARGKFLNRLRRGFGQLAQATSFRF